MVRRASIVATLALMIGGGCHAGPPPKVTAPEPPISRSDVSAARFIEQYNKNAVAVQSLTAEPVIALVGDDGKKKSRRRANGHLALERDQNFRLVMEVMAHDLADIGSNEQGFWFWVDDDPSNSIYVCDHNDVNQLSITLQPAWIMEAMGFREFTANEAQTVNSKPGTIPGTIILTQARKDEKGQLYTKETIVNEARGTVLEHRLYLGARKELIANAVISNYAGQLLNPAIKNPDPSKMVSGVVGTDNEVYFPEKFRLTWVKEGFTLDIAMAKVKVNPKLPAAQRAELFTEPKIAGASRKDLALLDPATTPATRTYESKPIPKVGAIHLGAPQPSPLGLEGTTRRSIDPLPLSPDLSSTPAQPAGIIGATVPTLADSGVASAPVTRPWRSAGLGR